MGRKDYELTISNNSKYIVGTTYLKNELEKSLIKIWNSEDLRLNNSIWCMCDFGGQRIAISDCGKYIATAQYDDYQANSLYIYDTILGEEKYVYKMFKKIQNIMFDGENTLIVGTENGIYFLDIKTGKYNNIIGENIFFNEYGEKIILIKSNLIKYNNRKIKASTFAYLTAIGTPRGVIVSEAVGNLKYYDSNGELIWDSNSREYGHFTHLLYCEKKNTIYGLVFNPRVQGDDRMNLMVYSEEKGELLKKVSISTTNYCLFRNEQNVILLGGNGIEYIFDDNGDCTILEGVL
ncbi:MAG: hypothetical protein ACI4GW_08430 [Lachnospiraceae bacterium]